MEPLYNDFQNVPNTNDKQIDIEKIYNKVITVGKDLNLITDVPVTHPFVTMVCIADYLEAKYKPQKGEINTIKVVTSPIRGWVKGYKELNPSVNGKRVSEVLSSLSQFVQYVKNRTTIERLTGTTDKNEK